MQWITRLSVITLALASLGSLAAAQTTAVPIGKDGDIELTQPTALGATVLKPGHYRLKHAMQDGQHFLVVSRQQMRMLRGGQHFATGGGTEVTRVACQVVPLDANSETPSCTRAHNRMDPVQSRRSAFVARAPAI